MNKSLLALLGVAVVLLVVYLIIHSARDVSYRPEPFVNIDTAAVDGIRIEGKQGDILLRKVGGEWRLAEPVDYPAEARFAHDLVGKLSTMEIETLISEDSAKDSLFKVDSSGTTIAVLNGADTLAHFIVGKTSDNYRHTYCRRVGDNKIYLVKGVLSGQLNRKAKDWRDKVILELAKENIAQIDFEYPAGTFSLVKEDSLWYVKTGDKTTPADKKMMDRLLNALGRFRTFDFVDGDSAKIIDFSQPDLVLTATTESGEIYRLALVPQNKEKNRFYVKKEGLETTVFVIYKGSANALMKHPEDFKAKEEPSKKKS